LNFSIFKVGIIAVGSVEDSAALSMRIEGMSDASNAPTRFIIQYIMNANPTELKMTPTRESDAIGTNHFLKFRKGISSPPAKSIIAPNTSMTIFKESISLVKKDKKGWSEMPAKIAQTNEGIIVFGAIRLI